MTSFRVSLAAALVFALTLAGCKTLDTISEMGTSVGVATGTINEQQAESINRASSAVGKTFESITPEQEYYIGRSVAVTLLRSYPPYSGETANHYINTVGQTLALASDRPETFGGYHFQIMNTDQINAFAAPGGLILVSRGLLKCCRSEDAVASVLAHEITHVQLQHGLQAISKERLTSAFTILASEGAKNLGGANAAQLTQSFEGAIGDITGTLVNSGYSRKFERQADAGAVTIMERVGYNPNALVDMLGEMSRRVKPEEGFGKTHPDPRERIAEVSQLIGSRQGAASPAPEARQARFLKALGSL